MKKLDKIRRKFNIVLIFILSFAEASFTVFDHDNETKLDNNLSSLVISITIDSGISPYVADYVHDAILEASAKKAAALLIFMDTPGGLYETTRHIVSDLLQSPVPIIVYVAPAGARAGSAGVFIALSAHILAMAPSTNIGAAHPVNMSGGDVEGDMKTKIVNDAKAWARSIAQTRGKNADWAEKAVVGSESISAIEAKNLNVIDFIANDVQELLQNSDGMSIKLLDKPQTLVLKNTEMREFSLSFSQAIMKFLSNPNLIYILLLLGILGVLIEFQSPGLILPGLFGVLCFGIVFGVQVLPINWFGVLLIFAAAAVFVAEIFIVSFGILAIVGLTLLIVGSYLLFSVEGSSFSVAPLIIWLLSGGFCLIMLLIGMALLKARRQKKTANVDGLVGAMGIVKEAIEPPDFGIVLLNGSFWRAYASEPIPKETKVVVIKIDSTKLMVEKTEG
jgi:membrane-bound serine protease (ClpP class)